MSKLTIPFLCLLLVSFAAGCKSNSPQTQTTPQPSAASEVPSVVAPINKARNTAKDAQQKALEREQMNPEIQPNTSEQTSGQSN